MNLNNFKWIWPWLFFKVKDQRASKSLNFVPFFICCENFFRKISENFMYGIWRDAFCVSIDIRTIFVESIWRSQLDLKQGRVHPFFKLQIPIKSLKINILKNGFQTLHEDCEEHAHCDFEHFFRPWALKLLFHYFYDFLYIKHTGIGITLQQVWDR